MLSETGKIGCKKLIKGTLDGYWGVFWSIWTVSRQKTDSFSLFKSSKDIFHARKHPFLHFFMSNFGPQITQKVIILTILISQAVQVPQGVILDHFSGHFGPFWSNIFAFLEQFLMKNALVFHFLSSKFWLQSHSESDYFDF